MYFMYVDESGDTGLVNSPSKHFILSGIVVHETKWHSVLNELIKFRRLMKAKFGLKLSEELHAGAFINRRGSYTRIPIYERLTIIREFSHHLALMGNEISIINVHVDKQNLQSTNQVFEYSWTKLIQRFSNTLYNANFPGSSDKNERGIIFPDNTDAKHLRQLLRRMRRYNYVPNQSFYGAGSRNIKIDNILEDPNFRDSSNSYFIQAADMTAFLLRQFFEPNTYMRKKAGRNYFKILEPVLCKVASPTDPHKLGIVHV